MTATIEKIIISKDFIEAPGARNIDEGKHSGEAFLKKLLLPKFEKALKENTILLIDLDNTEGYATSFLEEAFGGLARIYGSEKVLSHIDLKTEDEPLLKDEIEMYILDAKPL